MEEGPALEFPREIGKQTTVAGFVAIKESVENPLTSSSGLAEFERAYLTREGRPWTGPNPFWNKATDYTFSDWLAPYVLGVGVEDFEEYHLGGFPDLSLFLDRNKEKFSLNEGVYQDLAAKHLTDFGRKLKSWTRSHVWLDLGCGLPSQSVIPRLLAQTFEATAYIGVDLLNIERDEVRIGEFECYPTFPSYFFRSDIVTFISRFECRRPLTVIIAGLEFEDSTVSASAHPYIVEMMEELLRMTKPGDIIVAGAGTSTIDFPKSKFKRIYSDYYQEVYCRRRPRWWNGLFRSSR